MGIFVTNLPESTLERLIETARAVRLNAYAPYSKFWVGAAVLDEGGTISVGCNMENGAYPLGTCAEAVALGSMVASGGKECRVIVIVGTGDTLITPCGGCRQRIAELAVADTEIYCVAETGNERKKLSVDDVLPNGFRL